jgi:hypothetical protein
MDNEITCITCKFMARNEREGISGVHLREGAKKVFALMGILCIQ